MLEIMKTVSQIFDPEIMLPIIFIVGVIFFIYKKRKWDLILISSGLVTMSVVYPLKVLINKPRPDNMLIVESAGKAFPSGHSAIAGVFTAIAIYFIYRHVLINQKDNIKNKVFKIFLYLFVFVSFLLIPISRLYLHVHDIYDVVAGYGIGIIVTSLCIHTVHKYIK